MKRTIALLFIATALFALDTASASTSSTCQPMFNHQDDTVAQNNQCTNITFQPSSTAGSATITMNSNELGACVYTTAVQCDGEDINMQDIAAIDFTVTVPGNKCNPTEWVAVYMFPWCGQPGGCWDNGEREVDFVETTGSAGPGIFASNWDSRNVQVSWKNQGGYLIVSTGASQHITFTSSQIVSGTNSGTYQWDTWVCDASESKCDATNATWHAYRETGPTIFDESMIIVIDDWGVNNAPMNGCTVEVTDMVITQY